MKNKKQQPIECPSQIKIGEAIDVLSKQLLHVYQLLYFNGLTDPYGNPFCVERLPCNGAGGITTLIKIYPTSHPQYSFNVRGDESDESILHNVKTLLIQKDKPLISVNACCPLAERRNCVCVESFECPIHGTRRVGSHD